jgi:hypothetical protein
VHLTRFSDVAEFTIQAPLSLLTKCRLSFPTVSLKISSPYILCTKSHVPFPLLKSYQTSSLGPRHMYPLRNMAIFHGEEFLALRPTPKLEDHPFSDVRVCLFNTFAATLPISARSSLRSLRTRHAVITGSYLSRHYVSLNTIKRNTAYQNLHNWIINISTSQYNLYNKSECIHIP